ncbi:Speckle targeted PIP5K1A-regulated poly(A) polymerase [Euphorbia peplus]|nr:Speckle targeted PIP5K1A-regulated poly(A) polymerase [Euphorbia peplus]
MNANAILEPTLRDILEVIKPLREDFVVRAGVIEELKHIVSSIESFRGATVEPFGSFVSNLFTRWGDLDISIVFLNGSYISSAGKKRKQSLLVELLRALRQRGGWRRLQFVPNARVPILKFESRQSISCDISIDNLQGQMKSNFLFWISQIDGRFRDMVLLVKEWAKSHRINDPKNGTFNSYSLSLLVVFHFQTCVPAILPPLREIYPRNVADDLIGQRVVAEESIREICNANISKYMLDKRRPINQSSLSELFISFLAKFSDIRSKVGDLGICTFTGQWQDIRSTMRWLPKTYAIFVEDPFEQPENSARAVSAGNMERISEAFQTTYRSLILANQLRTSLLGILVRPQTLSFLVGAPVGNPGYGPTRYQSQQIGRPQINNTRPERHATYLNTRKPDNQMKNSRVEKHPNYFTKQKQETLPDNSLNQRNQSYPNTSARPRPAVHHNGQDQNVWRPKLDGRRIGDGFINEFQ